MLLGRATDSLPSFAGPPEQFALTGRFRTAALISAHGVAGGVPVPVAHWRSKLEDDALTPGFGHHSIILQNAGSDVRRVDSRRFGAERSAPGRILIIPAGMRAAWRSPTISDRSHFYLRPELVDLIAAEIADGARPELRDDRIFVADETLRRLLERYGRLAAGEASLIERDILVVEIVLALLRRHNGPGVLAEPAGGLTPRQERRLRELIEERIDDKLGLADLAAGVGCHPAALKRGARQALGMPLHQFVLERRLAQASALIARGLPLAEAALGSGFSSQAHLTSQMRRRWGTTPGQLRRSRS